PSNGTEGVDADMVQRLVDYYDNVKLEMTSPCTLEFKSLAKHHLQNSVHIRYNIYWPRCSCGLTSRALKKDVVTIAYNSPDATAKQNLLVATKSAEQLALWFDEQLHDDTYADIGDFVDTCYTEIMDKSEEIRTSGWEALRIL
ncbi:unnamed protein product, partial [Durusdinium trenchii]